MLAQLAEHYPIIKQTFEQASDTLGYNLWQLTQEGPAEKLNQTTHAQPALLVAGVSLWRVWQQQQGSQPNLFAGHSLGEYTALVCAEALAFEDAVLLVSLRGQFMQDAVQEGQGGMIAILGLPGEQVVDLCQQAAGDEILTVANYNAIGQTVVAGQSAALERVSSLAKENKAKLVKRLAVSVPSHCLLMKPAAEKLAEQLQEINIVAPKIPVVHNIDVSYKESAEAIHDALVRQLYEPVRWVETIQFMSQQQIDIIIESGPGKVLLGLIKRIEKDLTTMALTDSETLANALETV